MAEHKNCKQCKTQFEVTDNDLMFYKKMSPTFNGRTFDIPAPTLCPYCRWQRRIVWRNEYTLYKRKCDKTGREMISKHHSDTPFPVYYVDEWMSDSWSGTDYGQEYNPSRPFFEQLGELINKVPRQHALVDPTLDQNSEYQNCAGGSKNCYMIFESDRNEEVYYSRGMTDNKDCVDCTRGNESELCYEGIDVNKSFKCFFVQDVENCTECYFSSNLVGCKNCFGCDGLIQKEYYLFNENIGKEKWNEFIKNVKYTKSSISEYFKKLEEIKRISPKRFAKISKCENSTGDHLINCKNAQECFDCIKLEDCKYCFEVPNDAKDAMDFSTFGLTTNLIYECNSCGYNAYNILFSNDTWPNVRDCLYCDNVQSSKSCFGCVGLKHEEYCILNKKYSKEEYESTVATIIEKMIERGEWGEFMPMGISQYGYNETLANDYFPLDKEGAESIGAKWREDTRLVQYDGPFYEPKDDINDYISSEEDRKLLLSGVLKCETTNKPYKIIPQELAFYMKHGIPIPRTSFEARHKARINKRNKMRLWERQCDCERSGHNHTGRCQNKFRTSYSPEAPYKIYCEDCYQKTII